MVSGMYSDVHATPCPLYHHMLIACKMSGI